MSDSNGLKTAIIASIIALVLLYAIGLGLMVFAVYYSIDIMKLEVILNVDINIALYAIYAMISIGILTIIIGIIQSIGVINRIKKYMDKVIESDGIVNTQPSNSAQTPQAPTSVGGGLKIIRGQMPQAVAVEKTQPKKPAKSQSSTKTTTQVKAKPVQPAKAPSKKKNAAASGPTVSLEEGLQMIVDNYNTEKVMKSFKGWQNTLMMNFKDLGKSYLFVVDGSNGLEFSEGVDDEAAVQVVMDSDIFKKMMSKQINPIKAYSSGGLEVKGQMKNMLKLRKLMF